MALALQLAALVALSLSLLGISWLDARSRPRVLVLVDRSQSVPRAASDAALADVVRAAKAAGSGELQLLEFAGRPGAPSAHPADSVADLEPSATNIEAALDAALAAHAQAPFASVVMISDGLENAGVPHARCVRCTTHGCRSSGSLSVAHRRRLASLRCLRPSAPSPASGSRSQSNWRDDWIGRCASTQPRVR